MRKKYYGKDKPDFGPRTETIYNPDKVWESIELSIVDLVDIKRLLRQVTEPEQLLELQAIIDTRLDAIREDAKEPEEVDRVLWAGRLVPEYTVCSRDGCGCKTDKTKRHGPYWYHYQTQRQADSVGTLIKAGK